MLRMSESKIFELTSTYVSNMTENMKAFVVGGETIDDSNCLDMRTVRTKHFVTMPMRDEILKRIDQGRIKLKYDKTNPLGKMHTFLVYDMKGISAIIINCNTHFNDKTIVTANGDRKEYTVAGDEINVLIELLNMANVMLDVAYYPLKAYTNTTVKSDLMNLYTQMMLSVFSRKTTITGSDVVNDLKYYLNNFVIGTMFQMKNFEEYSNFSATVAEISPDDKTVNDARMGPDTYKDFPSLISALSTRFVALKEITVDLFARDFNIFYSALSVLALDYLPSLAALLASGTTNSLTLNRTFSKNFNDITKLGSTRMISCYRGM